ATSMHHASQHRLIDSRQQVALHPSPDWVLPSSQASPGSTLEFPHVSRHGGSPTPPAPAPTSDAPAAPALPPLGSPAPDAPAATSAAPAAPALPPVGSPPPWPPPSFVQAPPEQCSARPPQLVAIPNAVVPAMKRL